MMLESLPVEVLLKILSFLNPKDHFQVCNVNEYFADVVRLLKIRKINFSKNYDVKLADFDHPWFTKPKCTLLTSLNINCISWIPAQTLRTIIKRLINLESLYVLDTMLSVTVKDIEIYNGLPKLAKLAVSIRKYIDLSERFYRTFPKVKYLCLHLELHKCDGFLRFKYLAHSSMIEYRVILLNNQSASNIAYEECDYKNYKSVKYVFVDYSIYYTKVINVSAIDDVECATKRPRLSETDTDTLILKCKYNNLTSDINVRYLRKFCINYCLYHEHRDLIINVSQQASNMNELELWSCDCYFNCCHKKRITNEDFKLIGDFKELEYLTLDKIPDYVNSSNLKLIMQKCDKLKSLRINIVKQNSHLEHYICVALQYGANIKDLRIDTISFPINRFFEIYPDNKKLNRLLIKSSLYEKLDYGKMKSFLNRNPQLIFFYIALEQMPNNATKACKKILKTYMEKDCARYYRAEHGVSKLEYHPSIHLYDMMYYKSKIGYFDIFAEF